MYNIIIDIETLGRRNDAAITQVGIVIADAEFEIKEKHLIRIHQSAWHSCNRTFTGDTILWWLSQDNSPCAGNCYIEDAISTTVDSYEELLEKIREKFDGYNDDDSLIWTKGTMDLFCLKDLYEYFDTDTPWKFWQPRDIRTVKEFIKGWKTVQQNNHNALEDAVNQCMELKINL